jgi:hypothetical protein
LQPDRLDGGAEQRGELGGEGGDIGRLGTDLKTPCFDPRKVEQRVDELE